MKKSIMTEKEAVEHLLSLKRHEGITSDHAYFRTDDTSKTSAALNSLGVVGQQNAVIHLLDRSEVLLMGTHNVDLVKSKGVPIPTTLVDDGVDVLTGKASKTAIE